VDDIKTEEEQIAAIKNWWKENGNSLLMAVVAAIAIIFGWTCSLVFSVMLISKTRF
jgi:predicted negative regulator of RcsB-dependent stress response